MKRFPAGTPVSQMDEASDVRVRACVMASWERLLDDRESADVTFTCANGAEVRAHSLILSQASDVFKRMLAAPMVEGRTRTIQVDAFSETELRFILRLVYTGQVDESDWAGEDVGSTGVGEAGKHNRSGSVPQEPALTREESMILEASGVPIEIEPELMASPPTLHGFGRRRLATRQVADGKGYPPLKLVLSAASFGKRYELCGFQAWMVDRIKPRVSEMTFEEILRFAIREDFGPLRLHCVRFAEGSPTIRLKYDRKSYAPEVLFELQATWNAPSEPRGQKRKSF